MSVMSPNKQQKDASIDDDAELNALEQLLSAADNESEQQKPPKVASIPASIVPRLREDSTFADAFSYALDELPVSKLKQAQAESSKTADDFDSSDDEEVKNFLERKYNEYGNDINKKLKQQRVAKYEAEVNRDVAVLGNQVVETPVGLEVPVDANKSGWHIKNPHNPIKRHSLVSTSFKRAPPVNARNVATESSDSNSNQTRAAAKPFNSLTNGSAVFTDPVFGLRIINPLVSSALLVERMSGRKAIPFSGIAFHTQRGDLTKDWVIAGVLVKKNPIKLTKTGQPYSIWRISDLKGEIKMISLFLFKGAHKELWKTTTGICLAILNASVFEQRAESGDAACLSIDTAHKVMILGQSKDMGVCKAKKKNGEACTAIINLGDCDYCIYHMKQEFGKMSQRSELQSANAGRGLNELRNKVLGKSEVFYGGQSFTAVPAKKSAKQTAKDSNRMMSLSEYAFSPNAGDINHAAKPKSATITTVPYAARGGPVSKLATNVELSTKQRLKDLERLKILQAQDVAIAKAASEKQTSEALNRAATSPTSPKLDALKSRSSNLMTPTTPQASPSATTSTANATTSASTTIPDKFKDKCFSFASPQLTRENFCIEVNIGDRKSQLAKLKAMQVLKKKPIEKINPNSTRGSAVGKKRAIDDLNARYDSATKRQKIDEDQKEIDRKTRIQRIMDATSTHSNLIDMREQQERDQYFNKLEKKEALEEKMLNTFKIPCKAVICQKCKYTAFSAADHCKAEKHPLKVVDAEKRFFQCKDCGNRTTTVFKLPKVSCKNCKGSRWERAAMIRERKICDGSEGLSVRGDEETFIGSLAGKASLNLLVPDE